MRLILFILIVFNGICFSQNQITISKITKLSDSIKVKGKIVNAVQWTDSLGINLVVTSQTDIYREKNENLSKELFAEHYVINDHISTRLWNVYDFSLDCMVGIKASFLRNTFNVTDLDGNGVAEIWIMYLVGCGGTDVFDLKIIMYEAKTMYAMRGHNRSRLSPSHGGDYNYNFLHGPKVFKEFALKLWKANVEKPSWEQ